MLPERGKSMSKGRKDGRMFADLINQVAEEAISQQKEYKRGNWHLCKELS